MKEVTVVVPNKVGALAEIAEVLGNNGININSILGIGFEDKGIIRLITSDERSAMNVLTKYISTKKDHYEIKMADTIIVTIADKPGELAKVCKKIARAGINIESIYQLKKEGGYAELVIKPERVEEAVTALKKNGVEVRV